MSSFHPFVVGGPEANRKVLVTERQKFLWRGTDPVTDLLHRGVLVTDGEEHDRYRNLMEPVLSHLELPHFTGRMIRQTDRVTDTWLLAIPMVQFWMRRIRSAGLAGLAPLGAVFIVFSALWGVAQTLTGLGNHWKGHRV